MGAYRIASHRIVVSYRVVRATRGPLARVTRASRTHAPTPLTTMMTTTRRDDDTAATPCVAVAAVYHVGGVGVTWRRGDVTPPPRAWGGVGVTWRCGDVPSRPARGARRGRARARAAATWRHRAQLRLRSHARAIELAPPPPPKSPRAWWESVLRDGVMA